MKRKSNKTSKALFVKLICALVLTLPAMVHAISYEAQVLADNPIAYWRFEEASGAEAADSANANNGTYNNTTLAQVSAFPGLGNAAGFNGTTSFVSVPALGTVTDLTIEAWVNAINFPVNNWASLYNTEQWGSDRSHWQFVNGVYGSGTRFEWAMGFSDTRYSCRML